ncbi:MAG: DNA-directed RNA polymerase subunit K [Candidatus Diapherotrites archaeon]|nr:DNA-directed RNA polymerase subunit K [Candidatus Diapherotrites archaeon]
MEYTRFEEARILGARALQLAMGAPPLVKPKDGMSPLKLATSELEGGKIPITVIK